MEWKEIYKKVESQAEAAQKKLDKGLLIDKNEAAVIREKKLYDVMEKEREEERRKKEEEEKKKKEAEKEKEGKKGIEERKEEPEPQIEPEAKEGDMERDPVRAASWHTIHKLQQSPDLTYAELLDPSKTEVTKDAEGNITIRSTTTQKESEDRFLELTRKVWNEITIHKNPDLDAKSCVKLLELAGIKFDPNKIKEVEKGGTSESGIVMDTSGEHGTVSKEKGKRLIIDHHGKESDRTTSATKFVYKTLVDMGLLKEDPYLDKYVEFVTDIDNQTFTESDAKKIYDSLDGNLFGMQRNMEVDDILEFFRKGGDPAKGLDSDYLKNHFYHNPSTDKEESLEKYGEYLKGQKVVAERMIGKMEKQGFVLDTGRNRFGKILVDINIKKTDGNYKSRVPGVIGHLGARVKGFGAYVSWCPEENRFVIFTTAPMNEEMIPGGFKDGFNMRGNMWMKNDQAPMKSSLKEILTKLAGTDKFTATGKLKEYLDGEGQEENLPLAA